MWLLRFGWDAAGSRWPNSFLSTQCQKVTYSKSPTVERDAAEGRLVRSTIACLSWK